MKCAICGKEFELLVERHYIAREDDETGVSTFAHHTEPTCFDAFDCPFCGCQNVVGKRLRVLQENGSSDDATDESEV